MMGGMENMLDALEQPIDKRTKTYHFAPLLVLIVLAPTIAEVLLGDLLFNANFVPTLVINTLLYGSGAILVREGARRFRLGRLGILVLALAYGVIEEGLLLHSLFNPYFPGLESLGSYGRVFGVNWFWTPYVLGLHMIWSITIPILLTELLFPRQQSQSWLGRVGLGIDALVYLLMCLVVHQFFTSFTHFAASSIEIICTALVLVVLVSLALFGVRRLAAVPRDGGEGPAPWLVGLLAFLAGALFLGMFLFFPSISVVPALFPILLYGALYGVGAILIRRWSTQKMWGDRHLLALVVGALLNTMIIGFLLVSKGHLADFLFHTILCVGIMLLLAWIARRLHLSRGSLAARSESSLP